MAKLIERIKRWFNPECPREILGYKCHAGHVNYPNGCESCGRKGA